MTFLLDVTTELLLDGVWTDISADVYQRDEVRISRGRTAEGGQVDPSRCNLTLNNRSGNYSPRNPTGAHYGVLGRNTQLRVSTATGLDNYLALPGREESFVDTPDAAALDITGDIDIRIEVDPRTWRPAGFFGLARKYIQTGNQRSWALYLNPSGVLTIGWSPDGTLAALISKSSTAAVSSASGRLALRVTVDVDNGAAGNDVKFYTAPSIDGAWTQLGATVTTAGVTSIHAGTADLEVGRTAGAGLLGVTTDPLQGKLYAFELRDGIAGTVKASPDFTAADSGATTVTDGQGLVWTLNGNAVMANPDARFHGEVSVWPPRWDTTGSDVWTPLEAAGIMRRLGQGASALKSTMYRGVTTADAVVAYWPCEDGGDATELASGLPGYPPMTFTGDLDLASSSVFRCSESLPTASGLQWTGPVPTYGSTAAAQLRFLLAVPAAGVASTAIVARIRTNGSAPRWDLEVDTAGSLRLRIFDQEDVELSSSGWVTFAVNGKLLWVSVGLEKNGSDIDWEMVTLEVGQSSGSVSSGTQAGKTMGRVVRVAMNVGGTMDDVTVGHVTVQDQVTSIFDLADELNAYSGELATDRVLRLCRQEGLPVSLVGDVGDAAALGYQLPKALLELLREAAETDLGILYESREFAGLTYRTRASLYAQDAALALDYAAADLSSIEPVEDDQATRNDITVKRDGGSSARVERTTGTLSTAAPPDGVGRYDEEVTISLEADSQLPDQAGWRLHLGTVDEARYPVLGINLATPSFTADAALTTAAQALDIGDRLVVANPPAWLPPEDIQQIAQGFTETLTPHQWTIDVNCSPASPWDVGLWDDSTGPGEARYSSDGSTLAEALTTTETDVDVATTTGPLWSAADQPFDIVIGGERMTVTAVAGATSPQTFTVTRSVNGVVKTHASGAEVRLFKQAVYAL